MLNDIEKAFLQRFIEEEEMVKAVLRGVMKEVNERLPTIDPRDSDEIIGQRTRAYNTAKELLQDIFNDMVKYKGRKKINNQPDLAR